MNDMCHRIQVNASPQAVFGALTTAEGLRGWWTGDSVAEPLVRSVAEIGFSNRATVFRMEIEELVPARRVVWRCKGDVDEWVGRANVSPSRLSRRQSTRSTV
jgi:uncharacterized protein YndB with AHSA1/START domain